MKIFSFIFLILLLGCKPKQPVTSDAKVKAFSPQYVPGPHVMVYKTKANYDKLVPVELSDDKTQITSYPDPKDIRNDNGYQYPTPLHNGYLLDNRGIGKNAAFLKITYEEYAELQTPPSLKELLSMILDKDPLLELIDCGSLSAFPDMPAQLNEQIDNNKLRINCKVIK
jgi:hypothetical protein